MDEALDALKTIMKEDFGDGGNRVIVEDCLRARKPHTWSSLTARPSYPW
jgi:hypothetical protein